MSGSEYRWALVPLGVAGQGLLTLNTWAAVASDDLDDPVAIVSALEDGSWSWSVFAPNLRAHGISVGLSRDGCMDEVEQTLRDAGFQRFPIRRPAA